MKVGARYLALPPDERRQLLWVLAAGVLYTVHYLVWCWPQPFFIEDSAITFAYARNLVEGLGLVPYAGGERVEGYSNPLWTALIALTLAVGIPPWWGAKVLGWGFGILTLGLSWRLGRRARPDAQDDWAVIPPFLLATSTQFTVWGSSGLENGLFCVLLATGAWAMLRDADRPWSFPWSALAFAGLSLTRPDGVAYLVVAFAARLMLAVTRRQWAAPWLWLLVAAAPAGLYQLWRMEYFGWPWPNTYYAKERVFRPFLWTNDGWKKLREYLFNYGIIFAFPALALHLLGDTRRRRVLGAVVLAGLGVLVLWDGRLKDLVLWSEWKPWGIAVPGVTIPLPNALETWFNKSISPVWGEIRVSYVLGAAVLSGLLTLGRPGWATRGLLWAAWCTGVFFSIWSNGDWMKAYRWYSLTIVPQSVLIGVGIGMLAEGLPGADRRLAGVFSFKGVYALLLTVALCAPNVPHSYEFAFHPETAVRDVHRRVTYMSGVQKKLGLEHVKLLDVDMGAHMWYTDWEIADIAGLIDVSVAHHDWVKSFIEDYVFEERLPDFAHVHGAWSRTTKITDQPFYKERYLEIPGYPLGGRSLHIGNFIRKDLLLRAAPEREDRDLRFAGGAVTLRGWNVPSPEVAPGGRLHLRTTWQGASQGFRVVAFLASNGAVAASAELAPAFDWYPPQKWKPEELVRGDWDFPLPEDLAEGTYDLGFVLYELGANGHIMAWVPGEGVIAPDPVFARGEWRTAGVVQVVGRGRAIQEAEADRDAAGELARGGDCEAARERFRDAKRHIARDKRWHDAETPAMNAAFVDCYLARAEGEPDPLKRAATLVEAKWIDPRNDRMIAAGQAFGGELEALAAAARQAGELERAQLLYVAAVRVDGRRSHARRLAEELRDERLGLNLAERGKKAGGPVKPAKTVGKKEKDEGEKGAAKDEKGDEKAEKTTDDAPKGATPSPDAAASPDAVPGEKPAANIENPEAPPPTPPPAVGG